MVKKEIQKTERVSENIGNENLEKLRKVFPQFVKDGEADFDALKAFFDKEDIAAGAEKYGLNWAGKSNAFRAIRMPAAGTLTPQSKESKDWDKAENIFIEGDNLEALKLLQKRYRGQIKMIYIDPPYNTGKDFIYKDNFTENISDYYERTGQSEGGIKLTSNPESAGRYHSDWLTMMYPRLFLARNLLRDDGVMFISIDDNEVANLRMIMDEIFGEENFVADIIWQKKTGASDAVTISIITEYVLVYIKNNEFSQNIFSRNKQSYDLERYSLKDKFIEERGQHYIDNLDRGGLQYSDSLNYPITCPDGSVTYPNGRVDFVNDGWIWKWSKQKVSWGIENGFIEFRKSKSKKSGWSVCYKNYLLVDNENKKTERSAPLKNLIIDILNAEASSGIKNIFNLNIFQYSKPVELIKKIISFVDIKQNDIILDFFAGSGTTAHAVMAQNAEDGGNRKWICVQLPEATDEDSEAYKAGYKTIAEISRERIRRAGAKIAKGDIGFKSFALEKSNYRQWNVLTDKDDEKKLKEQMKLFAEKPLMDRYDEKSVVYEILLKEGFDLNANVSQSVIPAKAGIQHWTVMDGERKIFITFAKEIAKEQVEKLGFSENDIFVCLDSALDDTAKVNIMRNLTVKVI